MIYTRKGKTYGEYDPEKKVLYKHGLKRSHYLWKENGVPAIDKEMFDSVVITKIIITGYRNMWIDGEVFKQNARVINMGHGEQYVCPLEYWVIN